MMPGKWPHLLGRFAAGMTIALVGLFGVCVKAEETANKPKSRSGFVQLPTSEGETEPQMLTALTLSANGKLAAASCLSNGLWLLNSDSQKIVRTINTATGPVDGESQFIADTSLSADGTLVAIADPLGDVRIWNCATGEMVKKLQPFEYQSSSVCFAPNGKVLAAGGDNGTIVIWSLPDFAVLKKLKVHSDIIRDIRFSPDSRLLASSCYDNAIRIIDLQTYQRVAEFKGHVHPPCPIEFSDNGRLLCSGSSDTSVIVWDIATETAVAALRKHNSVMLADVEDTLIKTVVGVAFADDDKKVICLRMDGSLQVWNFSSDKRVVGHKVFRKLATCMARSADGSTLAVGGYDGQVKFIAVADLVGTDQQ